MPSKGQEQAVADAILAKTSSRYKREGNAVVESIDGDLSFTDLSDGERTGILADINFRGFTPEEAMDVIGNVVSDDDPKNWMKDVEPDAPDRGRYEVWQADMPRRPGEPELDFPEAYTRAAVVQAEGIDEAFLLTVHREGPWQENPGVEGTDGARSTMAGDVIIDPDRRAFRAGEAGFEEIEVELMPPVDQAALFREWRDDASQKPLAEKGVDYSDKPYGPPSRPDDYERAIQDSATRARPDNDRGRDR